MFEITKKSIPFGAHTLTLETGEIARQSDAAVIVSYGDTVVLVAVTAKREVKEGQDFFPLTVDYQEKTYAAGRIPGGWFDPPCTIVVAGGTLRAGGRGRRAHHRQNRVGRQLPV